MDTTPPRPISLVFSLLCNAPEFTFAVAQTDNQVTAQTMSGYTSLNLNQEV